MALDNGKSSLSSMFSETSLVKFERSTKLQELPAKKKKISEDPVVEEDGDPDKIARNLEKKRKRRERNERDTKERKESRLKQSTDKQPTDIEVGSIDTITQSISIDSDVNDSNEKFNNEMTVFAGNIPITESEKVYTLLYHYTNIFYVLYIHIKSIERHLYIHTRA